MPETGFSGPNKLCIMSFSRRDFFKKSLATGAGVAAASVLAPIPTEAQNKPAKKPIPLSVPEDVVPSTGDKVLLNKIRQARYVASKPKVSSLGILHYTDIHGDSIAAKKILSILCRAYQRIPLRSTVVERVRPCRKVPFRPRQS